MIRDGGPGSGIKGHTTKEIIGSIENPRLKEALKKLQKHVEAGEKAKYDPYPEKKLSERLEEERADINRYHPKIKTPKLNKEIERNKKLEKDTAEILRLSGFTTDADWDARIDFLEDEIRKLSKYGDRDSQQRLKGYKEELKAIQARQAKDGGPGSGIKGHTTSKEPSYTSRSGYNFEEPKVIEAAIKKVKASGHADPYYLAGLEQALQRSKKERGIKDSLEPQINQLRQKIKNLYDKAGDALNEKNKEKYNIIMSQIKVEEKNLNGLIRASNNDSWGEKVYTKGTEDACTKDAEHLVTWVKPSEINYKIGDIIQFKGKNVKITKITGNVVEAQVMDACSNKDSDPKVAEAEAIINLCGGVR